VRAADGATPLGDRRGKNSEKLSPSVVVGRRRPAADAIVRLVMKWKRPRRLAKGSGGHRLGRRNFHSLARCPTQAVREAETQAAERRPAGQRLPVVE